MREKPSDKAKVINYWISATAGGGGGHENTGRRTNEAVLINGKIHELWQKWVEMCKGLLIYSRAVKGLDWLYAS